MDTSTIHIGEICSILTAFVWAVAVILFKKSGERVHPIALNLFKNTLALILFFPTLWLLHQPLWNQAPVSTYLLFMASGAIGIGIADTLFFKALNQIGAGLTAIVDCLYSPFVIALSVLWLQEHLTLLQLMGALMVVIAVASTTSKGTVKEITRRDLFAGLLWGVVAVACMAIGIVMVKPLLNRSPLLLATEVRLLGGAAALCLIVLLHPMRHSILRSTISKGSWIYMLPGSFVGAYVAMLLWVAGMKYAPASISSALNQTSTIFVVIMAALFLHEPLTPRRIGAIVLAVAGAYLVAFG
jgi:drug/metabolite transporter (DMT)-like permease